MIGDDNCRGKGNVVATVVTNVNVNVRSMSMWYQQTWWATAKNQLVKCWKTTSRPLENIVFFYVFFLFRKLFVSF